MLTELSIFLVYWVPATGAASFVLLVGVKPEQSLPFPAVPVKVIAIPAILSG